MTWHGIAWHGPLSLQRLPRLYIFDLQSMELGPFFTTGRSHPCSQHLPRWRQPSVGGQKPSGRTLTVRDFSSHAQFPLVRKERALGNPPSRRGADPDPGRLVGQRATRCRQVERLNHAERVCAHKPSPEGLCGAA